MKRPRPPLPPLSPLDELLATRAVVAVGDEIAQKLVGLAAAAQRASHDHAGLAAVAQSAVRAGAADDPEALAEGLAEWCRDFARLSMRQAEDLARLQAEADPVRRLLPEAPADPQAVLERYAEAHGVAPPRKRRRRRRSRRR